MSQFTDTLQPASFRGVPFVVTTETVTAGRSVALHEYPFRDADPIWAEDTGRKGRRFPCNGFLVGDDVAQQRQDMLEAVETAGPGTLIHPQLGSLQVVVVQFQSGARADAGRVSEIAFDFLEAGAESVDATDDTGAAVDDAADGADEASDGGLISDLKGGIQDVRDTIGNAVSDVRDAIDATGIPDAIRDVRSFGQHVLSVGQDAASVFGAATRVTGAFGRFVGLRVGVGSVPGLATVQQALGAASAARDGVGQTVGRLTSLVGRL